MTFAPGSYLLIHAFYLGAAGGNSWRVLAQQTLVLGDIMLDEFLWGKVTRISPKSATSALISE